jgi:acetaldehyde dehydrogenase
MRVAIVGTGNIGTDLLEKLRRSPAVEIAMFAGIDPNSPGLARANEYGVPTSTDGLDSVLRLDPPVELVFEATSAAVHRASAALYAEHELRVIDLTPAKIGPPLIPAVNMHEARRALNVNLTTCGGQATVPVVSAVGSVTDIKYAEIVSTISSESAGPGTRQNIDEFTQTTAAALREIGGALEGKAIIILNPAEPAILMRNTIFCVVDAKADRSEITGAVTQMVERVQAYVPGYRLVAGPEFDSYEDGLMKVSTFVEVKGAGDFLPEYAGNLDIMTAAAVAVAERLAEDNAGVS